MRSLKTILIAALLTGVLSPLPGSIQPAGAAVLTVTRKNDPDPNGCRPNDCSLREAVIAANNRPGPDTIKLRRGRYELTRPGVEEDEAQTGDLDILRNTTITGAGPGKTIIDGNRHDRIFHFSSVVDKGKITNVAVVRGATLVDPQEGGGGGILNFGKVVLANTLIENNKSEDGDGGGISNEGRMVITRSRVTGNRTPGTGVGGGLYNKGGRLIFRNSRLDHNSAGGSTGGGLANTLFSYTLLAGSRVDHNRLPSGCCGGGVYSSDGSEFEAVNSSFTFNFNAGCCGGGLMSQGDDKIVLRHSIFADNLVEGCCGGGLMSQGSPAVLRDTLIARNKVEGCCGGGFMTQLGATAKLVNSRVVGNRAPSGIGGGILNQGGTMTLIGTLVRGNKTLGMGGAGAGIGIQTSSLALVLKSSTVADNSTGGDGGGIHIDGSAFAELTNSTISGNTAGDRGGGIRDETAGEIITKNVTITKNESGGQGGGISTNGDLWPIFLSIVAANQPNDCNTTLAAPAGKNLDKNGTCFTASAAIHRPPRLGPLRNNGGKTPTHQPRRSSRAVDAVPGSDCPPPARDQRGVRRPQNGDGQPGKKCDLGAVERKP